MYLYSILVWSNILPVQILLTLIGCYSALKDGSQSLIVPLANPTSNHTPTRSFFLPPVRARRFNWKPSRWRNFSRMLRTSVAGNEALCGKWKVEKIDLRRCRRASNSHFLLCPRFSILMLEDARANFKAAVTSPSWVATLAGVLPLSALIDFLDLRALHSFHLTGAVPLWCWPLTPGGSRLLLSEKHSADQCCLDEYGRSLGLRCLDGRFGDDFSASNPETLRMWLKSIKVNEFKNSHPNMSIGGIREQILEVVHVERQPTQKKGRRPLRLLFASLLGWILLAGLFVLTIIMQCYWALAFLVLMPLTGASITRIHVKGPRYLNIEGSSPFNRLVVVTQHMNETNWRVFYGESSVVNALLNKPLLRDRPGPKNEKSQASQSSHAEPINVQEELARPKNDKKSFLAKRGRVATGIELHAVRLALRFFVLGQWVVAIAAAALQGWDAYIIAF
jgi:hypothetical protein